MDFIEILISVLLIVSIFAIIQIGITVKRIGSVIGDLLEEIRSLNSKLDPLIDSIMTLSDKLNSTLTIVENRLSQLDSILDNFKTQISGVTSLVTHLKTENPARVLVNNLRAMSNGISAFWRNITS